MPADPTPSSPSADPTLAPPAPRAAIRDPRSAPVLGVDHHLPAVPAERARFAPMLRAFARAHAGEAGEGEPAAWVPEFTGDGQRLSDRPLRRAAVLIPLVRRPEGLSVLLTRRADHLNDHAGQVSFPGGRTDPGDADAIATALREAQEEVGLAADEIEVIGVLPTYTTVTAYEVTPVVGLLDAPRALALDAFEVAEVFEVPLAFLMDPANHRRHAVTVQDLSRRFLSMPWGADAAGQSYFIWGATAAMLRNLYGFLARD
jgi:8-oxo-dGTP pyrophosphatase MutT (NUDIX family)